MAVVEVRCPRCGSPCRKKGKTKHEYQCDHCESTFRYIDTTKRELIHDTRAHNCPTCGRPVKTGEGYICRNCETEYLCEDCVEFIKDEANLQKFICKPCLKEMGLGCDSCSSKYEIQCVVCGSKFCEQHAEANIDVEVEEHRRTLHYSLWCHGCEGYLCQKCWFTSYGCFGLGALQYHCKKCGSELRFHEPATERHRRENRKMGA